MELILKVLKDVDNDRYIFITYEKNKIVGLNYHQGIDDENINFSFRKPDVYLTETFNTMIARHPHCAHNDSQLSVIVDKAIKVHWSVLYPDQYEMYYIIRCDDPNRPYNILPDKHFELDDVRGLKNYLAFCNTHKLNYDLVIEEFDKNNEEVTDNFYLINNNHLNN